jgi:hypothetical protein
LRGVLEKVGVWTWFFAGVNVVDCVVNVVRKTSFFDDEKYATFFNFIFTSLNFIFRLGRPVAVCQMV